MTKREINRRIGERIKAFRKARGMTLFELGQRVGLSESTMQRYESGLIRNVPVKLIEDISYALGVSPIDILDFENENAGYFKDPKTVKMVQELKDDSRYRILFEASRKLSEDDLNIVVEMIKRMLPPEERDFFDVD